MKEYNRIIIIVLSSFLSLTTACNTRKSSSKDSNVALLKKIDSLAEKSTNEGFNGNILIAKDGNVIFHKTYGNNKMGTKAAFWVGSISKQFTASAILKLHDNNKLSVNDSISRFVENVPVDKAKITIHHLLTHTSGLANDYSVDGIINREEALDIILSAPLKSNVGEKFNYSAEGYNLLAIIVEIVSGESFEDYVSKNILSPANLGNTGFWGDNDKKSEYVTDFKNVDMMKSFLPTIYKEGMSIQNYGYKGATGIYSTAEDLYKWIGAIKDNSILKKHSVDQQFTPHSNVRGDTVNGTFYGYGWFMQYEEGDLKEIRHGGAEDGAVGHNAMIRFYDNGNIIIVLSNTGQYNGKGRLNGVEWSTVLSIGIRDIMVGSNKN
ncbi:serine hydrolase domain-containing protein [Aquimarina gracilis]|uniref:Serine hydrolase domain-containing protein n=1 Tax=Aquimarina gracilis TaxID=874422 RepID=A0ABU5ZRP7_9FLAO|nr:serine hydrolase domain-containing protein [Aquimarina gracilis]MEB3344740.1 serine hydrolase domain-containing protein [Aquimarina gracilis]